MPVTPAPASASTAAFERFVRDHYQSVFRFLLRRSRCREIAEDCTQTAFVKACRHLDRVEGNGRNWILAIAANVFHDHLRRCRYQINPYSIDAYEAETGLSVLETIADGSANTLRQLIDGQEVEMARERVGALDGEALKTLDAFLDAGNYQDAADRLGVPIGTVRSRLSRIRKVLRREA